MSGACQIGCDLDSPLILQNVRGGRVKLGGIVAPEMEYNHPDKGDALYAMELALSLEVRSVHSGHFRLF